MRRYRLVLARSWIWGSGRDTFVLGRNHSRRPLLKTPTHWRPHSLLKDAFSHCCLCILSFCQSWFLSFNLLPFIKLFHNKSFSSASTAAAGGGNGGCVGVFPTCVDLWLCSSAYMRVCAYVFGLIRARCGGWTDQVWVWWAGGAPPGPRERWESCQIYHHVINSSICFSLKVPSYEEFYCSLLNSPFLDFFSQTDFNS